MFNKAFRALGFIIRYTINFSKIENIVVISGRQGLESSCKIIERVQKILRYLYVRKNKILISFHTGESGPS